MLVFLPFVFSCSPSEKSFDYVVQTDLSSPEAPTETTDPIEDSDSTEIEPNPSSEDRSDTSDNSGICSAQDEGTRTGDCAQNFSLSDMNEDTVSLHDFYGQVIFLDLSSYT